MDTGGDRRAEGALSGELEAILAAGTLETWVGSQVSSMLILPNEWNREPGR